MISLGDHQTKILGTQLSNIHKQPSLNQYIYLNQGCSGNCALGIRAYKTIQWSSRVPARLWISSVQLLMPKATFMESAIYRVALDLCGFLIVMLFICICAQTITIPLYANCLKLRKYRWLARKTLLSVTGWAKGEAHPSLFISLLVSLSSRAAFLATQTNNNKLLH